MPNQEKDDRADSTPSSGYSGYGGQDSPGERGGRGTSGSSSDTSSSSSKGSSSSSSSSSSYSGTVGSPNDRTSYGDSRMGTGRDSSSVGGRDSGSSGAGYSGYGGEDSPSERSGRGTSGSQSSVSSTNVSDRFSNDFSLGTGLGQAYRDMADSATRAGISNLAGDSYSRAPSFRESEISGMAKLDRMQADARQALLDTIAGPESAGRYNVLYGGKTFNDFSDHPGIKTTITSGPNKGLKSSAAGAFQFIEPTWKDQKAKLGLTDFSPESQRAAAFNLAKENYAAKTGRNLETDLVSQDPERIASIGKALSGTWTSLPGGIEQGIGSTRFANTYLDNFMEADNRKGNRVTTSTPDNRVAEAAYRDPYATVRTPDYNPQSTAPAQSAGQQAINQVAAASPDRFRDKYLATPETGPTPQAKPQQELTTGQKIMAGAIDLGSGFIPGVGTGLGIVNAGLQLTGNQTIGERLVRSASAGTAPLEDQAGRSTADNGAVEMQAKAAETVAATPVQPTTPVQTVERFASKYLRPTPREKWSRA